MPFRTRARIEVENLSPDPVQGFYDQITWTETEIPEDRADVHAQLRRSNPFGYTHVHTLPDGVRGRNRVPSFMWTARAFPPLGSLNDLEVT